MRNLGFAGCTTEILGRLPNAAARPDSSIVAMASALETKRPAEGSWAAGSVELTILMPCLDEAETIATCVHKAQSFLARSGIAGEVLVADNGSTDGSVALAEGCGARVIAVNDLVRDMAGSISAEHGIGIDKIDELAHYRSKIELDTMRSLKRAIDPKNIMNPGKILRL